MESQIDEHREWRKTQPGRKGVKNDTRNGEWDNSKQPKIGKAIAAAIEKQVEKKLSHMIKESEAVTVRLEYADEVAETRCGDSGKVHRGGLQSNRG